MLVDRIRYGGVIAGQEEVDAAVAVLRGQEWASGWKAAEFEAAAAAVQGRRHALFCNSGSSALLLALAPLPRGTVVAMPAVQFPTLLSAALWCGLQPVLVDVDESLNMDPERLEQLITSQAVGAVAFVHMAGNPTNITEIAALCRESGAVLVEDVCEAFGAKAAGTLAGNFGLASATSTHAAHQISTGEGGLVFTDDEAAYLQMLRVRDWGRAYGSHDLGGYYRGYVFSVPGLNLHATDIQAAVGLVQLGRLPGFIERRRENYSYLLAKTADLPFATPRVAEGCEPSWYTFPMLASCQQARDELAAHLERNGIECRPIVAGNMARQPMAADANLDPDDYPVADRVFRCGLWVSVHPGLSAADLERIGGALAAFYG